MHNFSLATCKCMCVQSEYNIPHTLYKSIYIYIYIYDRDEGEYQTLHSAVQTHCR